MSQTENKNINNDDSKDNETIKSIENILENDETINKNDSNKKESENNEPILIETNNGDQIEILEDEDSAIKKEKEENITLKLGDIILITDPTNEILNNNIFLIDYIDQNKIKLINSESFEKVTLQINNSGVIGDGSISGIKILSTNEKEGYARQNDLLPGTWINIYIGGDLPTVITGEITNLEEDMIEVRTTDNDVIYLNFNYHGIPEDIPIETIEIRPPPESKKEKEIQEAEVDSDLEQLVELREDLGVPTQEVKQRIQKMLFDANDLQFGETIQIQEFVNIDKDKYRYNIDAQANDLLEEMISSIPNQKRTNNVLNSIHIMITRFLQLRELASTFDQNNNITGVVRKTADDRPLAEELAQFKNNLYWIMLVASNVKKIFIENEQTTLKTDYDTINLNSSTDIEYISNAFKSYRTSEANEGQNKYVHLYNEINPYMTPFEQGIQQDIFETSDGTIIKGDVKTDLNVIIDNLGELYSSVVSNAELTNRRFIIQRYNLGLTRLEATNLKTKGGRMIAHRVKLTNNDEIALKSVITLPEPTVRFSQINLPGTNLLVRANLNLHFLNYWELLKQQSDVTKIDIDGLDIDLEYDDSNFVDNIKNYMLNLSEYDRPELLSNLDIYKIFLRTIIPKIRILFSLVKKYIKGKLSMVDVIQYLEPFLIYPIDLTYMQYKEIDKFLIDKINEYNRIFKEHSNAFSYIKNIRRTNKFGHNKMVNSETYVFTNPIFSAIDGSNYSTTIMNEYNFNPKEMTISSSEFIKKIKEADYGSLFNSSVAFTNIQLMFPKELNEILKADKEKITNILEKDRVDTADKCTNYVISKNYYSKEQLLNDNGKNIYFDKEYDNTNYDLLSEKYSRERDRLSRDDLLIFLANEFKTKNKMSEKEANIFAETLVNQAKKVQDGQYAILNEKTETSVDTVLEYYVRQSDEWVLAKDVDPSWFIKDNDVLCNIDYNCLYTTNRDQCEPNEVAKDTIINSALKQILDQFDKNYNISKEELSKTLETHIKQYINAFNELEKIKKTEFYKYNEQKYNLGLSIEEQTKSIVVSPYAKLRDLILGQSDIVKRNSDILTFCRKYTYFGDPTVPNVNDGQMESEWWLYCDKTDTKLLPIFRYTLAKAFFKGAEIYQDTLDRLIKEIGKQSDDGNAWVDVHSGEILCYIDFDTSEGFKEGFVDKSREIMEKDAGEAFLEHKGLVKDKRLTAEGQIVTNIISTLSHDMGIDIEQSRDFIVKIVTELMNDTSVIEKEGAYKKREQEAAKKNKKLPEYSIVYSSTLMYLTLGMYLIGIQTSIPSVKTKKTFPGCVRSFSGFPLEGEGDDSGLNYLSCVSLKLRNPKTIPWNALPKNEEKISQTIKAFTTKFLLTNGEVNQKLREKVEYLLTNVEPDVPEEHSLSKWTNFLPPLRRFNVKRLENISDGFLDKLQNELKSGSPRQIENLLVIYSKIISYSMAIQESIQKIVEKKDLLLKSASNPFIDNACCNEKDSENITCIQYFSKDDPSIDNNNKIVNELSLLIKDIKTLTQSSSMLSKVNTKRIYPEIENEFSEETIYNAFIQFCHFQSNIPLTEDLAVVCLDKPDYLKKSDTTQEKIQKLKRDGRTYSKEMFLRLFQIVSRNNIIKISLNSDKTSCVEYLRKVLELFDKTDENIVPKSLTQKLEILVDNYDLVIEQDTTEMRTLKNYLELSNTNMRKDLIDFLKRRSKMTKIEFPKVVNFIEKLTSWSFEKSKRNYSIGDDSLNNQVTYYKNFIYLLTCVFPNMIKTQKQHTIQIPKYWGLSKSHEMDITKIVTNYYEPLDKFYGNNTLIPVLHEITSRIKSFHLLSETTPTLSPIQVGDKEVYSVFDKRLVSLLFEYYILSIFTEYIVIIKDPNIINKLLSFNDESSKKSLESDLFTRDFIIEQELRFSETEQEFIEGDINKLQDDVAKLLHSFIKIMMKTKDLLDVSFEDIQDKVYKQKEAEKYLFTDRLKDMTEDQRAVDTILKHNKLGTLYSIGLSKGLREYDPENFDHDKRVAEKIAELQNKLIKKGATDSTLDMDIDEAIQIEMIEKEIDEDAYRMNNTDDWDDGDPFGEEQEQTEYYD
jgi:hypothetical protein